MVGRFFTIWASREALKHNLNIMKWGGLAALCEFVSRPRCHFQVTVFTNICISYTGVPDSCWKYKSLEKPALSTSGQLSSCKDKTLWYLSASPRGKWGSFKAVASETSSVQYSLLAFSQLHLIHLYTFYIHFMYILVPNVEIDKWPCFLSFFLPLNQHSYHLLSIY